MADATIERAQNGRRRLANNYHGHLSESRELEILRNPDGVYLSQGGSERIIFRGGEDIVGGTIPTPDGRTLPPAVPIFP